MIVLLPIVAAIGIVAVLLWVVTSILEQSSSVFWETSRDLIIIFAVMTAIASLYVAVTEWHVESIDIADKILVFLAPVSIPVFLGLLLAAVFFVVSLLVMFLLGGITSLLNIGLDALITLILGFMKNAEREVDRWNV